MRTVTGPIGRGASTAGLLAVALLLPGASCETIVPRVAATSDAPSAGKFPHERLSLLLEKVVSEDGLVDYARLSLESATLEEYLAELARVSPDSHPALFPVEADQLAYWINAHNACALRGVLRWNRPPRLDNIAHRFDSDTTFLVGGRKLSLNGISNGIIRKRFPDPRVHFVLVKARRGGPPLSRSAYLPATLESRLEQAATDFLDDERNVQWKPPSTEVRLTQLILEFRGDFERQVPSTVSGDRRLLVAVDRWRKPGKKLVASSVVGIAFDERLNDVGNR
jgi:hypothetical protein